VLVGIVVEMLHPVSHYEALHFLALQLESAPLLTQGEDRLLALGQRGLQ